MTEPATPEPATPEPGVTDRGITAAGGSGHRGNTLGMRLALAFLGVALAVTYPLVLLTSLAWICAPVAVVAAVGLALWLRPRYRLAILDSSPLGVFYWLQRRT